MKDRKLDKQLAGYTAAAGAVLAGATSANATLHYTAADLTVNESNSSSIDIDGNGYDFMLSLNRGYAADLREAHIDGFGYSTGVAIDNDWAPINFGESGAIGGYTAGTNFFMYGADFFLYVGVATGSHPDTGFETSNTIRSDFFNFTAENPGYLGIQLGSGNYGWVHVDSIASDGLSYHVDGYAYEDTGAPATVAIPEPAALTMLAAGAAGILGLRRIFAM